jgi:hypothetical protein
MDEQTMLQAAEARLHDPPAPIVIAMNPGIRLNSRSSRSGYRLDVRLDIYEMTACGLVNHGSSQ